MTADFDIAIAGGGPAGAVAALVLARAGQRVLLAHAAPPHAVAMGESLPPNARGLLDRLGLLDQVLAQGHRVCHGNCSAWGSEQLVATDFVHQLHGSGLQLDRTVFDAGLRKAAEAAGAQLALDCRLLLDSAVPWSDSGKHDIELRQVHDGGSRKLSCNWLIDATGRGAVLARRLGAQRSVDDQLLAFRLHLHSSIGGDHNGSTWVEAVPEGWWYSVLLPGGERLVVYLSDADLVDRASWLDRTCMVAKLAQTRHLSALLHEHGYHAHGKVHGGAAGSSMLDQCANAGAGWLAVGDAAMAFDPIASRGIASAIYGGLCGASALLAHISGQSTALTHYQLHMAEVHAVYRQQLAQIYQQERRWPDSTFWRRRC